jgi:hypothetical protein
MAWSVWSILWSEGTKRRKISQRRSRKCTGVSRQSVALDDRNYHLIWRQ